MGKFEDFILAHEGDDPARLLLSRGRYPEIDIDLAVTTIESRRKLRSKVPEWYAVSSLIFPNTLSAEQCSSSETARYKASLAASLLWDGGGHINRIADLTGGLGVDSWAFSKVFGKVLYNEMDPILYKAAVINFKLLGINNIEICNYCLSSSEAEGVPVGEILSGFSPDILYLDPARRASDGRKVFLIEDCMPDVISLLPDLFSVSRFILLKLSPMADISMAADRLSHVREVHAVASCGECKELLFLLDRDREGEYAVIAAEPGGSFRFLPSEEKAATALLADSPDSIGDNLYLFEPGKALLKSGAFRLLSEQFGMIKAGNHTHLYLTEEVPEELKPLGKTFGILEIQPLASQVLKTVGKRWPRAEITARNVPLTSEILRKKMGCTSGGDIHIFGLRFDYTAAPSDNKLLITKLL